MTLDKNDPFLSRNLDRLEKRFRERYFVSLEKNRKREKKGKSPHQAVLKSIEHNRHRFIMVRLLRNLLIK